MDVIHSHSKTADQSHFWLGSAFDKEHSATIRAWFGVSFIEPEMTEDWGLSVWKSIGSAHRCEHSLSEILSPSSSACAPQQRQMCAVCAALRPTKYTRGNWFCAHGRAVEFYREHILCDAAAASSRHGGLGKFRGSARSIMWAARISFHLADQARTLWTRIRSV